jgi:hypothetical protein
MNGEQEKPGIIELLEEVEEAMKYEDRVSLENNTKKVIDKLTPVFEKGDIVKSILSDDSDEYTVEYRLFDIDREVIYYNSEDDSYSYNASELELVKRKEVKE